MPGLMIETMTCKRASLAAVPAWPGPPPWRSNSLRWKRRTARRRAARKAH